MLRPTVAALAVSLIVVAGLLPGLAFAGGPTQELLTSKSGRVVAELSWTRAEYEASDVHLRIERGGVLAYDEELVSGEGKPLVDIPQALKARDLDGDGEPEVTVDLYTGGAHCCFVTRIYRYEEDEGVYTFLEHAWGNPGYRRVDLNGDGVPELRSADDRFAYAFTSYAGSGLPIQIWRYEAGKLTDVTRRYRAEIKRDAAVWWRAYVRERGRADSDVRGVLAAWVADEYLLGRKQHALAVLEQARRRGDLAGPPPWRSGKRYVAALERFLAKLGTRERGRLGELPGTSIV